MRSNLMIDRLAMLCLSLLTFSQVFSQAIIDSRYSSETGELRQVILDSDVQESTLLDMLRADVSLHPQVEFKQTGKVFRDHMGNMHRRVDQAIGDIPVFGADLVLHDGATGTRAANGRFLSPNSTYNTMSPAISPEESVDLAKAYIGADVYMWEVQEMELFLKEEQGDASASFTPSPSLIFYAMNYPQEFSQLRLAYIMDIYAKSPISRSYVIIDAVNGNVLASYERIHDIDEPGTAQTSYSGNQGITTYRPNTSSPYQLRDDSRGGGVLTYDCFDTDNYAAAQIPTNTINDWDYGNVVGNAILDAHWGTEKTYDFFNQYGWSSYDNQNSPMRSYVHFSLIDFGYPSNNNAFWDGSRMTYGDGDGVNYNPLTAIDVIGHEICHGVTEFSSNLVYAWESGALNESYSDIFGACIEYYAKPNQFSWLLGNEMAVNGGAIRSMSNPNQFNDPDTYQGDFWWTSSGDNGGVHTNSGVQNFWFYLLSDGGSGVNDNFDAYNVQGIGIEAAGDIAFRTLTVYLTSSSDYDDARTYSIQSAIDLYGDCSDQVIAVTNAWHAVGIGSVYNNAVIADYYASANYSCTAPATFTFTNESFNSNAYLWDFGDGNTSSSVSPSHTYTTPGTYTVSLVSTGVAACGTSDTLTTTIIVDAVSPPTTASCQPVAPNASTSGGIIEFEFATITNSSMPANAGYQDFSCDFTSTVIEGQPYPFQVSLPTSGYLAVLIDANNDGVLDFTTELEYISTQEQQVHSGEIIIPHTTHFNTPLRVRAISSEDALLSACSISDDGQAEDYSVKIQDSQLAPIAGFSVSSATVEPNEVVQLTDISLNAPDNWSWSMPGATTSSSTTQNPTVSYPAVGQYDIQLIVSNAHGADTLFIPDYITVVNEINLCEQAASLSPNGVFYDPGGEFGNYGNNDNCTLHIAPPCATTVTLDFDQMSCESCCDFLRIYDGSSTSATLLGTFTGTSLPADITSSGPEIFVYWDTDGSVTSSGFKVNWTSAVGSSDTITAIASASNISPAFGATVQFNDISVESPYAWHWDFGDGNTSTEASPSHTYLTSGPKTVVLTSINCVSSDTDTLLITVQEPGGISVTPSQLTHNITNCGDSVFSEVMLYNTGVGQLDFEILPSTLEDNFESGVINSSIWSENSGGVVGDDCEIYAGASAIHFGTQSGERYLTTQEFTLATASEIRFFLHYSSSSGDCETVDNGEYVAIEYSTNGGTSYTIIDSWPILSQFYTYTEVVVPIPAAAVGVPAMYRIRQVDHSGQGTDGWSLDNFSLAGANGNSTAMPASGSVAAGDSTILTVTTLRAGRVVGQYDDEVIIQNNSAQAPQLVIPIDVNISGDGILDLPTCTDMGTIQEFSTTTDTILIYNTGCAPTLINNINSTDPAFSANFEDLIIYPNDSIYVAIEFAPPSFGTYLDSILFSADGVATGLCVSGVAVGAPIISSDPSMLDIQIINCGDSTTGSFYIHNQGNGPLDWEITEAFEDGFEFGFSNDWVETGTLTTSDDCGVYADDFSAIFEGNDRRLETGDLNLELGSIISFALSRGQGGTGCDIPETNDDLRLQYSLNGGVTWLNWYYFDTNSFVNFVEVEIPVESAQVGPNTRLRWYQPFFATSGDIWLLDEVSIETDGSSFLFDPLSGILADGDSMLVDYTYYREDQVAGPYQGEINVETNDPVNPTFEIPFSAVIQGDGIASYPSSCVIFAEIPETTSSLDSVYVVNSGCNAMALTGFASSDPYFGITQTDLILQPGDSIWVDIVYQPGTFGTHSATLDFLADGVTQAICLQGSAAGAPAIILDPSSLVLSGVDCPNTVTSSFMIINEGNGNLNWTAISTITDDFEGVSENPDLWASTGGFNSSTCGSANGVNAHRFAGSIRSATTVPLALSSGSLIEFYLFYGNGGSCETVDAGEHVVLEYSTDGFNYTEFASFPTLSDFYTFSLVSVTVPAAAAGSNTRIRIIQNSFSGSGNDHWAIDDFSIMSGSPDGFDLTPDNGIVLPGDTTVVQIEIDASNMMAGTYDQELLISSDDPSDPLTTLPITIIITGDGDLTTPSSNCVDFGDLFVGALSQDSVWVQNDGCNDIQIFSASTTQSDYSVTGYDAHLEPDSGAWVYLDFMPGSVGVINADLLLSTNFNDLMICLEGEGLVAPEINVTPPVLQVDFTECYQDVVKQVTINNTGGSDLIYNADLAFSGEDLILDTIINRWNAHYSELMADLPDVFEFIGGETSYYISDGGSDLYDSGNRLRTNLWSDIFYSQNTVIDSDNQFGSGSSYFTSKVPGAFLLAAKASNITEFEVFGNLGHDGAADQDIAQFEYTAGNVDYTGYVRRVYGTFNPSLNHLIITESSSSIVRDYYPTTSYEDHSISNLTGDRHIFYLMFPQTNGTYVEDTIIEELMQNFLDMIHEDNSFLTAMNPQAGVVLAGSSQTIDLTFTNEANEAGIYNSILTVNSNDPDDPVVEIPVTVNVPNIPCASYEFEYVNGCQGELQFINSSINDNGVYLWNFGDGTSSTQSNPTHIYNEAGFYTVTLTTGTPPLTSTYSQQVYAQPISATFIHTDPDDNNGTVDFASTAPTAEEWLWNFGDGFIDNAEFTQHTYASFGTYVVNLYVWDANDCPGSASDTIYYGVSSLPEFLGKDLSFYPNPVEDVLTIQWKDIASDVNVTLYDGLGKIVDAEQVLRVEVMEIHMGELPVGHYTLSFSQGESTWSTLIVKQ